MRAGRLNKRVVIAEPPYWSTLASAWAGIEPKLDAGYDNPESLKTDVPVTIRIRKRASINILPGMRVVFGTRLYDIVSLAATNERGNELLLNCREYVGEAAVYAPANGSPFGVTARLFTVADFDGGETETAERDTVIAILKSQMLDPPVLKDTIVFRDVTYTVAGLTEDGDNGIEYKLRVREP